MKQSHLKTRTVVLIAGALAAIAVAWAIGGLASAGEHAAVGDANCDGSVNSIDAALILQLHAGLIDEVCGDADVNEDGTVNSIDALLIIQFLVDVIILPHLTPTPTILPTEPTPEATEEPSGDLTTYLSIFGSPDNGIKVSLTLANKNQSKVMRQYLSSQRYDAVVRDAEGNHVWNQFHLVDYTQQLEWNVWEPGDWVTYDATWRFEDKAGNDVGPGTYELEAFDVGCTMDPTRQCALGETITVDLPAPPDCTGQDGPGADLIVSGDRDTFSSGENVSLTLVLFNCGETSTTRRYSSSYMYDFVIQDETGQIIWHWSRGMVFAQLENGRIFEPGEMFVHRTIWRQDTDDRPILPPELFNGGDLVSPGTYTLSGFDVSGCGIQDIDSCDLIASRTIEIVP